MKQSNDLVKVQDAINGYFGKDTVVQNFSEIPVEIRLAYLQKTPKNFIKEREIGGTTIPYIDHFYAEKALNFISNFNWGSEKIFSEIKESQSAKGKKMYTATVEIKCWLQFPNGAKIERYIASGHTMYENPAVTPADALQAAISKAHTKFARQFGIGTNIQEKEDSAYSRVEKYYVNKDITEVEESEVKAGATSDKVKENVMAGYEKMINEAKTVRELDASSKAFNRGRVANLITTKQFEELNKKIEEKRAKLTKSK